MLCTARVGVVSLSSELVLPLPEYFYSLEIRFVFNPLHSLRHRNRYSDRFGLLSTGALGRSTVHRLGVFDSDRPLRPRTTASFCQAQLSYHRTIALVLRRHPSGAPDRKSVVWGKSVSVRVDLGGRRIIKKKKT